TRIFIRRIRQRDFVPAVVSLAPVSRGPVVVQRIERFETRLKPLIELAPGVSVKRLVRILVADLPANHVGIVAEAAGKLSYDCRAELAIERIGIIELASAAVLGAASVGI